MDPQTMRWCSRLVKDFLGRDNSHLPSEASARLFRLMWQLESWLREMVYVELRARDADWQQSIKKVVRNWPPRSQASDKQLTHMATRHESAISYLTLGDLIQILVAPSEWPLFASHLPPRDIFESRQKEISQIRHRVAHFRDPHPADVDRAVLFLRDLDPGLWRFATSYAGNSRWTATKFADPVSTYFEDTHDQRWIVEMLAMDRPWRYAHERHDPRLGFYINCSTRPWFEEKEAGPANRPGLIYHARFRVLRGDGLPAERVLALTDSVHSNCMHIRLEDRSIEVMVPSVLGENAIVETIERFLEACIEHAGSGTTLDADRLEEIAAQWPEYVLGPSAILGFLDEEMPCTMVALD